MSRSLLSNNSDPYANLSQRVIERAHVNALYAQAPDLFRIIEKVPTGACDVGDGYVLLGPREHHDMDVPILEAFNSLRIRLPHHKKGLII